MCVLPAAICTTFASPATWTGVEREVKEPSPSCPFSLLPQVHTVPSALSTAVKLAPAATALTFESPATAAGADVASARPWPSAPQLSSPQARTVPSAASAALVP